MNHVCVFIYIYIYIYIYINIEPKDNCVSQFKVFIKEFYHRDPSSIIGIPCGIYVDEVTLRQACLRVL